MNLARILATRGPLTTLELLAALASQRGLVNPGPGSTTWPHYVASMTAAGITAANVLRLCRQSPRIDRVYCRDVPHWRLVR